MKGKEGELYDKGLILENKQQYVVVLYVNVYVFTLS